jgi:hypothetical protein
MDHDCQVCGDIRTGHRYPMDGINLAELTVDIDGISIPVEVVGEFWVDKYLCIECAGKLINKLSTEIRAKLWGKI